MRRESFPQTLVGRTGSEKSFQISWQTVHFDAQSGVGGTGRSASSFASAILAPSGSAAIKTGNDFAAR
ncbi:hypothetical protein PG999_009848 [Apiospora kogelbergensis]|uniref:Uncharacterized protein n=1 Tax=Apiospora kogelbergensis TaxID=1337665 RepID=A0AAW0QM37_9PEZI